MRWQVGINHRMEKRGIGEVLKERVLKAALRKARLLFEEHTQPKVTSHRRQKINTLNSFSPSHYICLAPPVSRQTEISVLGTMKVSGVTSYPT